jgi:hypothetical protein
MPSQRLYEFDDKENEIFARLSGAMLFVAVAMLLTGAILASAALGLARATLAGTAMLAPLGVAIAVIGAQLLRAARRFRRIVVTRGNDIGNLLTALDEMGSAYRVQRWMWITVALVIVVALISTLEAG